jgi:hypothetical protein
MAKVTLDTPLPTLADVADLFGLTAADVRRISRIVTESGSGQVERGRPAGRFAALKKISLNRAVSLNRLRKKTSA